MKDLYTQLGIKPRLSMAHHLQMDRQMECMNRDLQQYLQLSLLNISTSGQTGFHLHNSPIMQSSKLPPKNPPSKS